MLLIWHMERFQSMVQPPSLCNDFINPACSKGALVQNIPFWTNMGQLNIGATNLAQVKNAICYNCGILGLANP